MVLDYHSFTIAKLQKIIEIGKCFPDYFRRNSGVYNLTSGLSLHNEKESG